MKRGKRPPIEVNYKLTNGERLYKIVYKTKAKPYIDKHALRWIETNCYNCAHRNIGWIATSILNNEPLPWKHICCYPGKTFIQPEEHTCGCFKLETSQETSLKKP